MQLILRWFLVSSFANEESNIHLRERGGLNAGWAEKTQYTESLYSATATILYTSLHEKSCKLEKNHFNI